MILSIVFPLYEELTENKNFRGKVYESFSESVFNNVRTEHTRSRGRGLPLCTFGPGTVLDVLCTRKFLSEYSPKQTCDSPSQLEKSEGPPPRTPFRVPDSQVTVTLLTREDLGGFVNTLLQVNVRHVFRLINTPGSYPLPLKLLVLNRNL